MNAMDALHILPLLIVAVTALAVLLTLCVQRSHRVVAGLTLLGFLATLIATMFCGRPEGRSVAVLLKVDDAVLLFIGMLAAVGIIVTLLARAHWSLRPGRAEEFYMLLLLASLGAMIMVSADHLAALFLGLETLSVSLYAMMAYRRADPLGLEAGVKYLILAGATSAILLFGIALLYAEYGTMSLSQLAGSGGSLARLGPWGAAGLAMLIAGLCFKLALVPFHLWTPDIYQGAPIPATAFVATVSKGAVLVFVLRHFGPGSCFEGVLQPVYFILAIASMFVGNLLALRQRNVKRILAYSSIAHMGYLLVPLAAGGPAAATAVAFYLIAYFAAMLGALGVVDLPVNRRRGIQSLGDLRSLAWDAPGPAAAFSVSIFSLAGIPVAAGFLAKVYVLASGVATGSWWLALALIASSVIGLYYYLRMIVTVFMSPRSVARPEHVHHPAEPSHVASAARFFALAMSMLVLIWLGVYPSFVLRVIELCVRKS